MNCRWMDFTGQESVDKSESEGLKLHKMESIVQIPHIYT